ncbi:hypothetical protein DAPPUDRAFT_104768 [Daphnia pulex]|uniref:Ionotropic glutamate receptor C-terminal domain-containing protein n=1 Tax=Daphnia pulex TaxID=6669 RepID=E9GNA2_DAPPU|nr:hypothetical protein DAPPUDRAFT_104768 [Daphnia pulex]|eukprot:EFX79068.1 hypothetical protein DAPPUDRAFT_104768 [Daphnia pulex]
MQDIPFFSTLSKSKIFRTRLMLLLVFLVNSLSSSEATSLNGKHLSVAPSSFPVAITVERNSSGHVIAMDGVSPRMLEWMSARFNFSYSIFHYLNKTSIEGTKEIPGFAFYLANGQCDLVMGAIGITTTRIVLVDLSSGYLYSSVTFMIPMPDSMNNIAAVVKPFQLPVWIAIFCVFPCVSAAFYFSQQFYQVAINNKRLLSSFFSSYLFYISGVLLNQGSYCPDKRLFVRCIASAWCLAAFVLVTSYNSLLISYVTTPNAEPLIRSIQDLSNASRIHVVVNGGQGFDIILSNGIYPNGSIYKDLRDKLRNYPKSRCRTTETCVDLVKSGNHVYINTLLAIMDAMQKDFKTTGKCDLALVKETEYSLPWTWALAKKSLYTEYINRGLLIF